MGAEENARLRGAMNQSQWKFLGQELDRIRREHFEKIKDMPMPPDLKAFKRKIRRWEKAEERGLLKPVDFIEGKRC